jgi:hypothetical protein
VIGAAIFASNSSIDVKPLAFIGNSRRAMQR